MLELIKRENIAYSKKELQSSLFHFSIGDYYDVSNINFGKLRVLNDVTYLRGASIPLHQHRNLEVITYIISGKFNHKDSLSYEYLLEEGDVQLLSCGTGLYHGGENATNDELRLLHLWVLPETLSTKPSHSVVKTNNFKNNNIQKIIGREDSLLTINQDFNMYILKLDKEKEYFFKLIENRKVYLVLLEGSLQVNDLVLEKQDALKTSQVNLNLKAIENSHILILEMAK